jgi:hypothetical protein
LGINDIGEDSWVGSLSLSAVDASNVSSGGAGRSTASTRGSTSATVDNTNVSVLVDTDVGSVDNQAASSVRDVVGKG